MPWGQFDRRVLRYMKTVFAQKAEQLPGLWSDLQGGPARGRGGMDPMDRSKLAARPENAPRFPYYFVGFLVMEDIEKHSVSYAGVGQAGPFIDEIPVEKYYITDSGRYCPGPR